MPTRGDSFNTWEKILEIFQFATITDVHSRRNSLVQDVRSHRVTRIRKEETFMFEKHPDQARERWLVLLSGGGALVIGLIFFFWRGGAVSFAFLLPGLAFVLIAIFCSHEGFMTAMQIGKFFQWFS